jgi:hypothetical protein
VYWSGHGNDDGSLETYDGRRIKPEDIGPDAARVASVKLFVMSSCLVGQHSARWQKALGPQAQVIGWGAPITNDRAIDFLTPDDASTKDFDDLLDRHLGVKRVMADGALVEAAELSRKHEDRLSALMLSFDELVDACGKRLKLAPHRGKGGEAYFMVPTPSSKDQPKIERSQSVRLAPTGFADSFIFVSSLVGPYSEALDIVRALRLLTPMLHLRLTLSKVSPPDQEFVLVETLFRRRRLDPITLSRNLILVGMQADRIEDLFFGSDRR